MRRTRRLAAIAAVALALLALGAVAVAHRASQPRHRAETIGRTLTLPTVQAKPTPAEPLTAFPTTTCPGFGMPRGWRVVWSDLQRGGDLHSEARAPGSQVSIACDRGPAAAVDRLPTAPPGMRALRVAGRGGVTLELLAPTGAYRAALPLFRRVVAAQRRAGTLQRSHSRVLHWRPVEGRRLLQRPDLRRQQPHRARLAAPAAAAGAGAAAARRPLYDWYAWPAYGSYEHPRFGPALASARLVGAPRSLSKSGRRGRSLTGSQLPARGNRRSRSVSCLGQARTARLPIDKEHHQMRPSTLRAAALCGGLLLAGIGAPAASAATDAGFANVLGSEPIGSFTNLQNTRAFNTARIDATTPQAIVFHARTGRYSVRFPGLAVTNQSFVSGGVTVRATGGANAVCQPAGKPHGTVNSQLEQDVSCFDAFGGVRDSSFSVSFVHGQADVDDLIVARSENVLGAAFAPFAVQETTLAGASKPGANVFGRRTAVGQYELELARTTGSGPAVTMLSAVNNDQAGQGAVICGILSSKDGKSARPGAGKVRKVSVSCRGPLNTGPKDVALDVTHSQGSNASGVVLLSAATVDAPLTTAASTVLPDTRAFNRPGRFVSPGVTLLRTSVGRYEVDLPAEAPEATQDIAVNAVGGTANCLVTSTLALPNRAQAVRIACTSNVNQPVDSAFQLLFEAQI